MQTAKSSNEATLFMLKKEKEIKLNYSKMGRESGDISHTQIKRYINGETSCVPDKPLRVLVNTFGDSPSRKNWLRMKLRERCKQSNKISKKKR